jgi:hypothetical protein
MPEFLSPMTKLMPASFVCFRGQDHVSHGSDGNGQEGMLLVRGPCSRAHKNPYTRSNQPFSGRYGIADTI